MKSPGWLARIAASINTKIGQEAEFRIVLRGGAVVLGLQLLRSGISFAALVVLARLIGIEQYGIFAFYFSLITVLSLFGGLGIPAAAVRFLAEYRENGDWQRLKGYLRFAAVVTLLSATGITFTAGAVSAVFGLNYGGGPAIVYWTAFATVPLLSLVRLQSETARAFLWPWLFEGPARTLTPAVLLVGTTLVWVLGYNPDARHAMGVTAVGALAACLVLFFGLGRKLRPLLRDHRPIYERRRWFLTAGPMLLSSGAGVMLNELDILLVGVFLPPQDVAIYQAAARVSMLSAMFIYAQNSFVGPRIAALFQSGRREGIQQFLKKSIRLTLAMSVLFCLGLVLFGGFILSLFGREFAAGYPVLIILLGSVLATTATGPLGLILNMTGHAKTGAIILSGAVILGAVLQVLFIPRFGIIGAALAVFLANILARIVLLYAVKVKTGLGSSIFAFRRER